MNSRITVEDALSEEMRIITADGAEAKEIWSMKEKGEPLVGGDAERVEKGKVYTKEYTYAVRDDVVLTGSFETNDGVEVRDGETVLNRIDYDPQLGKGVGLDVRVLDVSGAETEYPVSDTHFQLKDSAGNIVWEGDGDENGAVNIPYKDGGKVLMENGKTYTLHQTATNETLAHLPDRDWTLSVSEKGVVTASVVDGESELTKNLTARGGRFVVWNFGKEDATMPLVPLNIQKIWTDTQGLTPTEVAFTVMGVDAATGERYPLKAYAKNRSKEKPIPDGVDVLTAAEGWSRRVYVPIGKRVDGKLVYFYDQSNDTYIKLSDGTYAYKLSEDGITVSGELPRGAWSSVEGEGAEEIRTDKFVKVEEKPESLEDYPGYVGLGATTHSNANKPSDATDYRFESGRSPTPSPTAPSSNRGRTGSSTPTA